MKVHSLRIKNAGRLSGDRSFLFADRTLILGANESGKSTMLDAVRWLLTGRCAGIDGRGGGVEKLRTVGVDDDLLVSATVSHNGQTAEITRVWSPRLGSAFAVDGWSGTPQMQYDQFLEWAGVTRPELLPMALDGEVFYSQKAADARDALLATVTIEVPAEDGSESTVSVTLDQLDGLHKRASDLRRAVRADIKAIGKLLPPAEPVGDLEGVRGRLADLRKQLEEKVAHWSAGRASAASEHQAKVAALRISLNAIKAPANLAERSDAELDELLQFSSVSLQPAVDDARAAVEAAERALADITAGATGDVRARMATLEAHDPKQGCVLDAAVPCKTAAKAFHEAAKQLLSQAVDVENRVALATQAVTDAKGVLEVSLRSQQDQITNSRGVALEIERRRLVAELAALEATPPAPEAADELQGPIEQLRERIAKGDEILQKKIALAEQHRVFGEQSARLRELQNREASLDADVERFGPKGLRVKALADSIGRFVDDINRHLVPFGYTVAITVDPWSLTVNGVALERWSWSQRLRVSFALQSALADMSGLRMTVLDQIDALLNEPRQKLGALLRDSTLDQVIVARAFEPGLETPSVGGMAVLRLLPN